MLGDAQLVAFAPTTDLERSAAFYGAVLGLKQVDSTPFSIVFDAGGSPLWITLVEERAQAPYTVLGWQVDDLEATMAGLTRRGLLFLFYDEMSQDDHGVWTSPSGSRIAWFSDPDGNNISLQQRPAA